MKGKLAVFTIVLAVFAIVLVATTVADAQICMCQMCRTDVPGCETVQYPRGCACILKRDKLPDLWELYPHLRVHRLSRLSLLGSKGRR